MVSAVLTGCCMFPKLRVLFLFTLVLSGVTASADHFRYLTGLPSNEAEAVRYEIEKLSVAGLDTSPVIAKVREGLAKNIPGEKITLAVRQEVGMRIRSGRMITDAGLKLEEELVNSLALAMRRGAQEKDLAIALRQGGEVRQILQTIDQVGIMAQKGITGEKALEQAMRSGTALSGSAGMQDVTQKGLLYQHNIRRDQAGRLPTKATASDGLTEPKVEHGQQGIVIR